MKTVSQKNLPTDPHSQHHHHHHHHPHQHPLALASNVLDIFPTSLLQPSPAAPSRNHGFKMGFDGEGSTFTRLPDYLLSPAIQPPKSKLVEILDQRFNDPREACALSDSESEECESGEEQPDDEETRDEKDGASEGADENDIGEEHPNTQQPQRQQGHSPTKKHRHANPTKGDIFHEKDPLQAQVWTLFTTAKCSLPNGHGRRLENLTWRLKGMSLNKKEEKTKKGEEEPSQVEDGMEIEATHVGTTGRIDAQDVVEATPSASEATLPIEPLSSDASQQQLQQQQQQQQWLDLQLQQGPPLDTLLDTSSPTIPLPTHTQDQPHLLLFPDDFSWIDSAMDPETLRVLSDFEMPEGAMWTAEAQKQLQMHLQSSTAPYDHLSSYPPSTTAPRSDAHSYDDVFNNSNDDDDDHEHENDGNDTDSTVTDPDPHLDANRMQDFDNDASDVEESHPKSKPSSAPVVVVQAPMHCNNCKTQQTSLWRRGVDGQTLCNACALFYKLHGRSRPKNLKSNVIKTRNRASMAHPSKKKSARNQPLGSGPAIGSFPASSTPSTKIGEILDSEAPEKHSGQRSTANVEGTASTQERHSTSEDDVEQAKLISEMTNLLEVASSLAAKSNLSEPSLPPTTTTTTSSSSSTTATVSSLPPPVSAPTSIPPVHWEFSSSPATPTPPSPGLPIVPPTSQPHFQGDYSAIENNPDYYSLLVDPIPVPPFYHQNIGYFRPSPPTSQSQPQPFLSMGSSESTWPMSSDTAFMSPPGAISYMPVLVPVRVAVPTPCNNINSSNINTPGSASFDPCHPQQQQQPIFLLDQQQQQQQEQGRQGQFYQQTPWGYHRM